MNKTSRSFTPREIASELDRYVVGQLKAKRAVAIALRNRWRRQQVAPELRDEIAPKNILMIGPTGVGKTEIARRLAKLAEAPFIKVEASKFTEVGYVGRDVESIVRDLVESAVKMVRKEALEDVRVRAADAAEDRLVQLLANGGAPRPSSPTGPTMMGPFVVPGGARPPPPPRVEEPSGLRDDLRKGKLDERVVELDVHEAGPSISMLAGPGMEDLEQRLGDVLQSLPGFRGKTKRRKMRVPDARRALEAEEAARLVDDDKVVRDAVERTEQTGIVFLDEIDKVAGRQGAHGGPDVSREGVQRDLLPIVEGSTVSTKYGPVKTDHVLFIAAGAFHVAKVADLIPELQGRFPIRVELDSLEKDDFVRILREPKNALIRQYEALLETEGFTLRFTDDAIDAIASYAAEANRRAENIGARRLHTILEALLEDVSFTAPERAERTLTIDAAAVSKTLEPVMGDEHLAKYVL